MGLDGLSHDLPPADRRSQGLKESCGEDNYRSISQLAIRAALGFPWTIEGDGYHDPGNPCGTMERTES
jgi:hypothetical protein